MKRYDNSWVLPNDVVDEPLYLASEVDPMLAKFNAAADLHAHILADKNASIAEYDNDNLALSQSVVKLGARIAELEGGLRNCLLLAMRKAHRDPSSDWEHVIRFCKEVGCGPSPLSSTEGKGDGQ